MTYHEQGNRVHAGQAAEQAQADEVDVDICQRRLEVVLLQLLTVRRQGLEKDSPRAKLLLLGSQELCGSRGIRKDGVADGSGNERQKALEEENVTPFLQHAPFGDRGEAGCEETTKAAGNGGDGGVEPDALGEFVATVAVAGLGLDMWMANGMGLLWRMNLQGSQGVSDARHDARLGSSKDGTSNGETGVRGGEGNAHCDDAKGKGDEAQPDTGTKLFAGNVGRAKERIGWSAHIFSPEEREERKLTFQTTHK